MKAETKKAIVDNDLKNMLQQTDETLAAHFEKQMVKGNLKRFRVADLWRLEKNQRSSHIVRRQLN
jgi:hypothetical protein